MDKILKKKYVLIIMILAVVCILAGTSYAYFTAMADSDDQIVDSGVLRLTYHTGKILL